MAWLPRRTEFPGILGAILFAMFAAFWTSWSLGELYYEGWGTPFPWPLAYLMPCALALLLAAATLRWPRVMGAAVILLSVLFYGWAMTMNLRRWGFSWGLVLSWAGLGVATVLAGVLFIVDGIRRARDRTAGEDAARPWWLRRLQPLIVFGVPAIVAASMSVAQLPRLLGRLDDGGRGLRIIEGDGVRLAWAPEGPGWNWLQPWGGYPSWDSLALYGVAPVGPKTRREPDSGHATAEDMARTGLCGHLDLEGTTLVDEPPHIWRMPTADEFVRSLTWRGQSAGCVWNGQAGLASCRSRPDKETPLWAPDQSPVYMWTASERSDQAAWYVNYLGHVGWQPKEFGNPRHGYRCVKVVP